MGPTTFTKKKIKDIFGSTPEVYEDQQQVSFCPNVLITDKDIVCFFYLFIVSLVGDTG